MLVDRSLAELAASDGSASAPIADDRLLPTQEIERALGQTMQEALDLRSWEDHGGLEHMLARIGRFVATTVQADEQLGQAIRTHVLRPLEWFTDAPANAGVYRIDERHLRAALQNHLLPGAVTAVQAACTGHESVTASLISIGISLVRYDGEQRSWRTTFLRHDYDLTAGPSLEEVRRFLDRQGQRDQSEQGLGRDRLTYLLRRGFTTAAERKALLERTTTPWRLGHGVPAPLELLTGAGSMALLDHILPILDQLLLQQQRWLFLPSTSNAALLALAHALQPGELGIFVKGKASLQDILERGHFPPAHRQRVLRFATELGEQMVIGGFRATPYSPARLFAAHTQHALAAGILALADAQLQPHRGTPLLLDLAAESAKVGLGIEAFQGSIESATARAQDRHRCARAGLSGKVAPS